LARKWLFHTTVEKISYMGVLLGFGDAQIAQLHLAHDVGENVIQRLRRNHDRQGELLVVAGHRDVMEVLGDAVAGNRGIEIVSAGQITATVRSPPPVSAQRAGDWGYAGGAEVQTDAGDRKS